MKTGILTLSLLMFVLAACGGVDPASLSTSAKAPALDKADGMDGADHGCQVILRSVGRNPAANGEDDETDCSSGECLYVWRGSVDVAEDVPGETQVLVLYHLKSDSNWWEVRGEALYTSTPGFRSYSFAMSEHLFGPGGGEAQEIELVAFLQDADGSRLFDHNARQGDFENLGLSAYNTYAGGDLGVCQPMVGDLWFSKEWMTTAYGARRQGGYLRVNYELERLPECRGTHNGYPCWDIVAHVRFLPGGQEASGSVRRFVTQNGTPTNQAEAVPFVTLIPEDADQVQVWFENFSGCGQSCSAWDSNYGDNYEFDIWPPADDPRCQDVERDRGQRYEDPRMAWNDPTCLPYKIAGDYNATSCEFWLDGLGLGFVGHYGIPFHWLLSYLKVGPQDGTVQNAGLFTRFHDNGSGSVGVRFSLGVQESEGLWRTGFAYQITGFQGVQGRDVTVDEFAFFIDVKRPSGEVVRLWQSRGGQNYRPSDAFSMATYTEYIPYGNIQWADQAASVFDSKHACGN
jgi:hypothetical protein